MVAGISSAVLGPKKQVTKQNLKRKCATRSKRKQFKQFKQQKNTLLSWLTRKVVDESESVSTAVHQ